MKDKDAAHSLQAITLHYYWGFSVSHAGQQLLDKREGSRGGRRSDEMRGLFT